MEDPTLINEPTVPTTPAERPSGRIRRWLTRLALFGLLAAIVAALGLFLAILVLAGDLPEIRTLADYQPPQATVVYGARGQVVARFAKERRTVVAYDRVPQVMIDAVLSAEDSDFFNHQGLDYLGIARCFVKNTLSGRKVCGASTVTQQTVKTFFLDPEKTYTRKLREMILTKRLEEALEKKDILFLYLNQIYFGQGAYGIQEAARVYFGKDVARLTVEEAALLAGLPQSPNGHDPYRHPERALKRRAYVLGRMRELNRIDEATYQAALASPLDLDWRSNESDLDSNNHYAAQVRLQLDELVGKERAESGGLSVYTGLDPLLQRAAEDAVRRGLLELDKRQGWRGPIQKLERDQSRNLLGLLEARLLEIRPKTETSTGAPLIFDLSKLEEVRTPPEPEAIMEHARFRRLRPSSSFAGVVIKVDDSGKEVLVSLGGAHVHLPLRTGLGWARPFNITKTTRRPNSPSEVLSLGDIVRVRTTALKPGPSGEVPHYFGVLDQTPKVEAALVAIDPLSREVRALVGGYGVGAGTFNRAIQARRQAGSTFKPFVYGAAFESKSFTPVSRCLDAPRVYRDPFTGRSWKPENYGKTFDGDLSLRTALTLSKNICSVELIDKLGVDPVLDMAKRVGIDSPLPRNLTLALGSGDVTPLEMTNAYATLASGGEVAVPIFIQKVVAPGGEVLFEAKREVKTAMSAEVAYQVTSLMQSVVEDGTAQRVKVLNRPVAGKTGTTNESRNAWFIGYTPDLVAGVWVGFDNNDPLGPQETGGRAAIPIWLDLMTVATQGAPVRDFTAPSGIVFALVDPVTGKLATPDVKGARSEPFLSGTEPTEVYDSGRPADRAAWEDYE